MGTNIMLWKYILKDQNESKVTYLVLLLDNNNCEKKAKIMYKWYFELLFICIHTNNINYDLIQLKKTYVIVSLERVGKATIIEKRR